MADQKISALTSNPGIDGTEEVPTARSGSNFKNTFNALLTWLRGLIPYDLSTAPSNSVPVINAAKTALIPLVLFDGAIEAEVYVGSALAGTWTYNNGASGVGATLTRTTNGALATTDGVTSIVGRTYLQNQWTGANRIRNGVYELTQVGSAGTPAIFTRLTNSDSTAELNSQAVVITLGSTTNRGKIYTQTTASPTVGTSNIIYQTASIAAPSVAPTPITVAAAQALVTAGTVVVGRVYSITDSAAALNAADRIWIRGVGPDEFDQNALYIDSVNNQRNEIIYWIDDVPTDSILFRKDNFGNEIWDTIGLGTIAAFDFGNNLWTGNKSTTGFTLSGTPNTLTGNYFQEDVTISAPSNDGTVSNNKCGQSSVLVVDGGVISNNIIGASASVNSETLISGNIIGDGAQVTCNTLAGESIVNCIIGDSAIISSNGFDLVGCKFPNGYTFTADKNYTNVDFSDGGFATIGGGSFSIIKSVKNSINSASVKTLNSVPVTAVAAPGAGYAIEVISATVRNTFNTTAFDAGTRLYLKTATADEHQFTDTAVLESTLTVIRGMAGNAPAVDVSTIKDNQALTITANADSVAGDGSLDVYINYRIIQL